MTHRRQSEFTETLLTEISEAVERAGYLEWSLAGDLDYAARCVRDCAKRMQRDDRADTSLARHNMRAVASRLDRLARELPIVGNQKDVF